MRAADPPAKGWSDKPLVEMLIPSTTGDSLALPGQHVASLFCQQVPPVLAGGANWDDHREAATDDMIETVVCGHPTSRQA